MPQKLVSFSLTHGGRTYNITAPPRPAVEGLVAAAARPATSEAGRIFFILVDDLHLDFRNTGARERPVQAHLERAGSRRRHVRDRLDRAVGIEIDLTYDRRRLDEAARKFSGSALSPDDIIATPTGRAGPGGSPSQGARRVRDRADAIRQLEPVHDRRKAFIYISNGYDLDPYAKTRAKNEAERYGVAARQRRQQQSERPGRCASRAISSRSPISPASWPR